MSKIRRFLRTSSFSIFANSAPVNTGAFCLLRKRRAGSFIKLPALLFDDDFLLFSFKQVDCSVTDITRGNEPARLRWNIRSYSKKHQICKQNPKNSYQFSFLKNKSYLVSYAWILQHKELHVNVFSVYFIYILIIS